MCSAITTAVDAKVANNDYFKRRILGFKAEIEFEKFINEKFEKKIEFLEGGQFISKKISGQKDDKNSFDVLNSSEMLYQFILFYVSYISVENYDKFSEKHNK